MDLPFLHWWRTSIERNTIPMDSVTRRILWTHIIENPGVDSWTDASKCQNPKDQNLPFSISRLCCCLSYSCLGNLAPYGEWIATSCRMVSLQFSHLHVKKKLCFLHSSNTSPRLKYYCLIWTTEPLTIARRVGYVSYPAFGHACLCEDLPMVSYFTSCFFQEVLRYFLPRCRHISHGRILSVQPALFSLYYPGNPKKGPSDWRWPSSLCLGFNFLAKCSWTSFVCNLD